MAVTRLSDLVIVPEIFSASVTLHTLSTNAFLRSGVAVQDSELNAFLSSSLGGKVFSPRYLGPLEDTDPNISSDDPSIKSIPNKIAGLKNTCVRQSLNNSWSSMDLAADLYGSDPIGTITAQVGDYWSTVMTKRVLASLRGVIADNVLTNAGDMVVDISAETGVEALFNPNAFIDAKTTMGDLSGKLTAMAVHSTVYATMQKLDLVDFLQASDIAGQPIPYYGNVRLIVDDGMTTEGTEVTKKYYSYLYGYGAIALGMGSARVPAEVQRDPTAGKGAGQETLFSRQELIIHPQGFEFALTETPTMAQLVDVENWKRAFERKRVPLACLITKG